MLATTLPPSATPPMANGFCPPTLEGGQQSKKQLMLITPEIALFYLQNCKFPNQRGLRRAQVIRLIKVIRAGDWDGEQQSIDFCVLNGQMILVNGQHRLTAIHESGIAVWAEVRFIQKASLAAVQKQYASYDHHIGRSKADVIRAHDLAGEFGLSPTRAAAIAAAATLIDLGFAKGNVSRWTYALASDSEIQIQSARNWLPYGAHFFGVVDGGDGDVNIALTTKAVLGVALVTFAHCAVRAEAFWGAVAANDGLKRGTPEHSLVKFLGSVSRTAKREGTYCRYVASAWNAFYQGRSLQKLYGQEGQKQIWIEGTPFNGRDLVIAPYLLESKD